MDDELELVQTCGACPEQYDVLDGEGKNIGYLRLRHGSFRAEYMGETVYTANPRGDGLFEEDERNFYLNRAVAAIKEARACGGQIRDRGELPEGWKRR